MSSFVFQKHLKRGGCCCSLNRENNSNSDNVGREKLQRADRDAGLDFQGFGTPIVATFSNQTLLHLGSQIRAGFSKVLSI